MSIPLYEVREASFHLEMVHNKRSDEEDLKLAALDELGEIYEEDDWDEEFKDEERYRQTCSQEGPEHENI